MSHWTMWWICWLVLGFCVPEGIALFNKTAGDTLSETVWNWLRGKNDYDNGGTIKWNHNTWRTWVVGAFLLWLFFHLTFGWFAG